MTQTAIKKQVNAIRKATKDAIKSPESAREFLIDAGIITGTAKNKKSPKRK